MTGQLYDLSKDELSTVLCNYLLMSCMISILWQISSNFRAGAHFTNNLKIIAIKFCTWHDHFAVVACAKTCCNLMASNWNTTRRSFRRIGIASNIFFTKMGPRACRENGWHTGVRIMLIVLIDVFTRPRLMTQSEFVTYLQDWYESMATKYNGSVHAKPEEYSTSIYSNVSNSISDRDKIIQ